MDIGANGIVSWIASSTTSSLATYTPIYVLIGGLVLAVGVISAILGFFGAGSGEHMDMDDTIEI